jgi:PhzF family phenazine biosynthesis protein
METERWSAFTDRSAGGNPAGVVVIDADREVSEAEMQRIAAEVGYSETAFVRPASAEGVFETRYFAPEVEVAFCGHATIATGVALARRYPPMRRALLRTALAGDVPLSIAGDGDDPVVSLWSPPTSGRPLPDADLDQLLTHFGWTVDDIDASIPLEIANAGNDHPVIALRDRGTLRDMSYPFDEVRELMVARGWTTIQLVHRRGDDAFDSRNPFAVGGVVEDPATGAAAAAFGGLLRRHDLLPSSGRVTIVQGVEMGRRSVLHVDASGVDGDPVVVSGTGGQHRAWTSPSTTGRCRSQRSHATPTGSC